MTNGVAELDVDGTSVKLWFVKTISVGFIRV